MGYLYFKSVKEPRSDEELSGGESCARARYFAMGRFKNRHSFGGHLQTSGGKINNMGD